MIPVKYAAGCAAFIFHDQSERTPYEYANQITYIKEHGYDKQPLPVDHIHSVQGTDCSNQKNPDQHDLIGGFSGGYHIIFESLMVDFIFDRSKPIGKELLRAKSNLIFYRNDLEDHINHPNNP